MAETEFVAHLRFAPESMDLLHKFREDLIIVHHALGESPEGKAAFERFITAMAGSFEKLFEIGESPPVLSEATIAQGVAKGIESVLLGPKPSGEHLPLKD